MILQPLLVLRHPRHRVEIRHRDAQVCHQLERSVQDLLAASCPCQVSRLLKAQAVNRKEELELEGMERKQ